MTHFVTFALHPIVDRRCGCDNPECSQAGKHPLEAWGRVPDDRPELVPTEHQGVGIATGARSGVFVIDLDTKNGVDGVVELDRLAEPHGGMPLTYTVATPSGGFHLYYRHPGFPVRNSAPKSNPLGPGIDIRGDGGYVVAPGSPHRNGGRYVVAADLPIADAPSWLLAWPGLRKAEGAKAEPAADVEERFAHVPRDYRIAVARKWLANEPAAISGAGGSGAAMRAIAGATRGFVLTDAEMVNAAILDWNARCVPPWGGSELAHKIDEALHRSTVPWNAQSVDMTYRLDSVPTAAATARSDDRPAPLPRFPVEHLPAVLRAFVVELALFTEVPVDLPAMFALAACAAAIAGKIDLEVRAGYIEPLNLFVVVGAKTGERKSPVHVACFGPLNEVERLKVEAAAPLITRAKARRDVLQKLLTKKQAEFAGLKREDVPLERANNASKPGGVAIEREIAEAATELEKLQVPSVPKLLTSDVTPEKLASLMGEQNGRMCVASDEGTILSIIAGRYAKDGRSSFDVLLQGYSGTPIRVDRQSADRPPVYVRRPRLTVCIAVQPEVIEKLSRDETMRSQGLLARFLYALPASMVGQRPVAGNVMPGDVRSAYEGVVRALANVPTPEERGLDEIPRIRLSTEARDLHLALQRELEPRLDPKTGDLAEIVDWASKYAGNVARIAGVLHCVKHGPIGEVSGETMRQAIGIGEYLLAHAQAAFGSMGKSIAEKDAETLFAWATKRGRPFTVRDARQLAPRSIRSDKKRIAEAIEHLEACGQLLQAGGAWAPAGVATVVSVAEVAP